LPSERIKRFIRTGILETAMVTRRLLMAAAGSIALSPLRAVAQQGSFESEAMHRGRATVPVFLNGEGPYQFMVDTAATASLISSDLAKRLQLPPAGAIGMHTLVGREVVPAVRVARMNTGALNAPDVLLAVGSRAAISGLDGLLGCDLLADRKVILNLNGTERVRIARSSAPPRSFRPGITPGIPVVIAGERRLGSLIAVPSQVGRSPAVAIIDSGAEGTILNRAAALAGRAMPLTPGDGQSIRRVQSPTGQVTWGQAMLLPSLRLVGGVDVSNLAVAVGDFHSFRIWGLDNQPAVLIGMDILRRFKSVHIDLKRSELSLHI